MLVIGRQRGAGKNENAYLLTVPGIFSISHFLREGQLLKTSAVTHLACAKPDKDKNVNVATFYGYIYYLDCKKPSIR